MSNPYSTRDTEQKVLNDAKNATYQTLDVTPYVETGVGVSVPLGYQASLPISATDLDIRDLTFATDKVDVSGSTGVGVTGTFFQATQPVSGTVTAAQATAASLNMTEASAAAIKTAVELIDNAISGTEMQVDVLAALPAGTNLVGDVAIQPRTTGGWTPSSATALSSTKTAVKASAGVLGGYIIHNPSAATTYIQVWNVAIGSITVGTTAPTYVLGIPAGSTANVEFTVGIGHSVEINVAATTTATGSTAPATAAVCTFLYK